VPVTRHSGKRPFPECQGKGTRGRGHLPRVPRKRHSGKSFSNFFKRLRLFTPSNATFLFRVPFFPECNSSPSATLGEDCLPRVPDFWHSGKHVALGEYCFSRSDVWLPILPWMLNCSQTEETIERTSVYLLSFRLHFCADK
jgi:hypothetical protein